MSEEIDRKIAVIFATDVVSYSKHMEANESETVKNLRVCEKILTKLFKKHGGSLFNTGGDSFLAEFSSAVGAIECAVEFQNEIKARNTSDKITIPLQFRVGVNTGDVIKEKGNLLGDGVNIAARLEALAQTGGITISKGVYDYVKGKTKYEYNDLGVQKVKENEFHAYDLILNSSQRRKLKTQKLNVPIIGAVVAALVVGLISLFYLNFNRSSIDYKENKINLLIVPFQALSKGENTEVIATGITDHISTTLANFDELFIFDKSSAEYFIKKSLSTELLSSEYNVNYRLDGNVQTANFKTRVNVKLENILEKNIVWSEVLDFETKDIFEVQAIYPHPSYDRNVNNDIGLIRLKKAVPSQMATPIPWLEDLTLPTDGTPILKTGWGSTDVVNKGPYPDDLKSTIANTIGNYDYDFCGSDTDFKAVSYLFSINTFNMLEISSYILMVISNSPSALISPVIMFSFSML